MRRNFSGSALNWTLGLGWLILGILALTSSVGAHPFDKLHAILHKYSIFHVVLHQFPAPASVVAGCVLVVQLLLTILVSRRAEELASASESALRESEQRFRDLYENASDLIWTRDLSGKFTSINKAAEHLTGYSEKEVVNLTIGEILTPDSAEAFSHTTQSLLGGERPSVIEVTVRTKDGRTVPLEVKSRLIFRNGSPAGCQSIARDITERKREEQLVQDRRETLQMIVENERLESVFLKIVRMIERHCNGGIAALSTVQNRRLTLEVAPGLPAECAAAWGVLPAGQAECGSGAAVQRREPVTVCDIETDPLWEKHRATALAQGLRACCALPVLSGHRVVAVAEIFHREPGEPDSFEFSVLQTAAELVGVAIEHHSLTNRLAYEAHHDPLTALPNRALVEDRLQQAIAFAHRRQKPMALLYIDLDRFKLVNDTLGHAAGDLLLQRVAQRFRKCLRESDTLARTGGDEFLVILSEIEQAGDVLTVGNLLVSALERPVRVGGEELFVSASIGAAVYPEHGQDAATLQRRADTAMYQAKSRGGSRVEKYDQSMETHAQKRLTIENDLHRALERQELALHYQPQYCAVTGKLVGLEGLLRWKHPQLGDIPPVRFIPIAEQSGLLPGITNWALKEACAQSRRWKTAGLKPPKIALNISASQLARPDIVAHVSRALERFGVQPSLLELELTESAVMENVEESIIQMTRLKELGVKVSIDDFGSGYSSLSYLRFLPVTNLKIDQSFLPLPGEDSNAGMVIQAISDLAHGLGITVTAEGVELEEHLNLLRAAGCDYIQGYWLGRAMPPDVITELLSSKTTIPAASDLDLMGAVSVIQLP